MYDREVASCYKEYPLGQLMTNVVVGHASNGIMVEKIIYHEPQGEGDQHYCDIVFAGGKTTRVFRPDTVALAEEEVPEDDYDENG